MSGKSPSTKLAEQAVWAALESVVDPCSIATGVPISLVEMGLIKEVHVQSGSASIEMCITGPFCFQLLNIRQAVEESVLKIEGIHDVELNIDHLAEWTPGMIDEDARERLRKVRPRQGGVHAPF